MIKLSVAYTNQLYPILRKYKEHINDIYFSDGEFDSARGSTSFDEGEHLSIEELKEIKSLGIKLNYVLNSPYLPNRLLNKHKDITEHLLSLKEEGLVDIITVNNLILANNKHFMKTLNENFEVKNSVNNHINSALKTKEICERFPTIDNIIVDRSVNRNPELIKEMADICHSYGKKITVLINEGCLYNCIFKRDCDLTFSSQDSVGSEDNGIFNCYKENFKKHNDRYLKSPWMTAEGVEMLEGVVDIFKISGRYDPPDEIEKRIRYYLYNDRDVMLRHILDKVLNEKYDEIYNLSMMELSVWGMSRTLTNCKNDCMNCDKCDVFLEKYKEDKND